MTNVVLSCARSPRAHAQKGTITVDWPNNPCMSAAIPSQDISMLSYWIHGLDLVQTVDTPGLDMHVVAMLVGRNSTCSM